MPITQADFTAFGINNFELPANAGRLESYNQVADDPRVLDLLNDIETVNNANLRHRLVAGKEIFVQHRAVEPSYIEIGPVGARIRYYVRSHIGNGIYGSICKVSTNLDAGGPFLTLKLQRVTYPGYNPNNLLKIVKEGIVNFILSRAYPASYNIIHKIGKASFVNGSDIRIYYLLENLNQTLHSEIISVGNPIGENNADGYSPGQVRVGNIISSALCNIAQILRRAYDTYSANHGDLHTNNIMDGKIIDFGFFRLIYEDILFECDPEFNNRLSESRDLTNIIFYIWHISKGSDCSKKDILRPMIEFGNPSEDVFDEFQPWHIPDFKMTVVPLEIQALKAQALAAAQLAGKLVYEQGKYQQAVNIENIPPISLGPLYKYFNVYENNSVSFDIVEARLLCEDIEMAGGRKRDQRRRKVLARYTRRHVKKYTQKRSRRRSRRASSSLH